MTGRDDRVVVASVPVAGAGCGEDRLHVLAEAPAEHFAVGPQDERGIRTEVTRELDVLHVDLVLDQMHETGE